MHIGNLRTYIFQDILKRTLAYNGYRVRHIMNITDVDDKTIAGATKAKTTLSAFTKRYETAFKKDLKNLNIKAPFRFTRATEHIKDMVALITKLLLDGFAYEKDGSVYFDISRFPHYGRLARINQERMKTGIRIDADEYAKNAAQDFVLWKAVKEGEPSWRAPFGAGRPGWHIECSAMASRYLGQPFDMHSGGVDLIFPHHENEIAQSEAAEKKQFAHFWLHGEHLLVENAKMSKSLGNIFTLRDLEARGVSPIAFRYLVLTAHYRSKLNFTWESLTAAQQSLNNLYEFIHELKKGKKHKTRDKRQKWINKYEQKFNQAITNDLDTPRAIAVIWELIRDYRKNPAQYHAREILKMLYHFDEALGFGFKNIKSEKIPTQILKLTAVREQFRKEKKWQEADVIRAKITEAGFLLKDTSTGLEIKPS